MRGIRLIAGEDVVNLNQYSNVTVLPELDQTSVGRQCDRTAYSHSTVRMQHTILEHLFSCNTGAFGDINKPRRFLLKVMRY